MERQLRAKAGLRMGRAAPARFFHPTTKVRVFVHGDKIIFAGTETKLKKVELKVRERYDDKVRGVLGSERKDSRAIEILGRTLRWTSERWG